MKELEKVIIVIPAYEPDDRLIDLLETIRAKSSSPVVLVNDGSGPKYDHYFEVARNEFQCTVLNNAVNLGKGRALKNAFNYVLNTYLDAVGVVTADSDGQHSIDDIVLCQQALVAHPKNLVLGVRNFEGENVPKKSAFGNKLTRKICKFLCGLNISDTQTGLRGISCDFMRRLLSVKGERFEFETYMLIETKNFCEITEVPIHTIYESKTEHQTHFDPIRDSLKIYKIFGGIFLKYIFSSCSSAVIDLALFWLLSKFLLQWHAVFYVTLATVFARVASSLYNYAINYSFVFLSRERKSVSAAKYFSLVVVQMLASAALTTLGVLYIPFLSELVVKIIVDSILFLVSYYIQRKYIF